LKNLNELLPDWPKKVLETLYFWLIKPFEVIPRIGLQFLVFILITILSGHFGVVAAFFASRSDVEASNFLGGQFQNGVLYNLAIAFLVSAVVPIWLEPIDRENPSFRGVKQFVLACSFLVVCLSLILLTSAANRSVTVVNLAFQLVFYVTSLYLTTYLFVLQYLHLYQGDFAMLETMRRDALRSMPSSASEDSRGIPS
jgi:hypothetical protein